MTMLYIGIDNGVSGSIGIVNESGSFSLFCPMPARQEQDYVKKKANCTRVDWRKLREFVRGNIVFRGKGAKAFLERPMVNPTRFVATKSALRALESTLVVLESFHIPVQYVDSREWQKVMLPQGVKGPAELKKASLDIGMRLFPALADAIRKQKDSDGLLMAEWARRERR